MPQRVARLAYSIAEFAEVAGLGRSFIYEEIKALRLKVHKAGRRSIILAEDGHAYLQSLPVLHAAALSNSPADHATPAEEASDRTV